MRQTISTNNAPKAIGPYSQGIRFSGEIVWVSGQIPLDPETGQMVEGGIQAQASRVMKNLKGVIEAAGYTMGDVVKTTIYLTTMDHFKAVNEVYGEYFPEDPPARATIAVAGLPLNALVEIEAVAVRA